MTNSMITQMKKILVKAVSVFIAVAVLIVPVHVKAVEAACELTSLTFSNLNLSPSFSPDNYNYTASVMNDCSSIAVTATANNTDCSITINGITAASGASVKIPISAGTTNVSIVLAKQGYVKMYTVEISKQSSPAPKLFSLCISSGKLSPSFFSDTTYYTADVAGDVLGTSIIPTAADSTYSLTVNGIAVSSGSPCYVPLNVGENQISVTVSSGSSSTVYVISITRQAGSNSFVGLSNLSVSTGALSPVFSPNTSSYSVNTDVSSITVTPTAAESGQAVTVNGATVQSGSPQTINLTAGYNIVTINVTSADGISKSYSVDITRTLSDTAPSLSGLSLSTGNLSPSFAANAVSYTASVNAAGIYITADAANSSQSITINGTSVQSGTPLYINLQNGENAVSIAVISNTGSKTYTINITRLSSDCLLSALTLSSETLSPEFDPQVVSYKATVESDIEKVTVLATAAEVSSKIKINGSTATSVVLIPGDNVINVAVTAANGSVKTYSVTVTRKYVDKISVTTPDINGVYSAAVPDYTPKLKDTDELTFTLGSDTVQIPASTLKTYYGSGGLTLKKSASANDVFTKIYNTAPQGSIALSAADLKLSGGTANDNSALGARVTFKFSGDEEAQLKTGIPVIYYYDISTGTYEDTGASFDISSGTAVFTAQKCGTYVTAIELTGSVYDYNVAPDSVYSTVGSVKTFNVRVTREKGSAKLLNAQLLVISTYANGKQICCTSAVTSDDCIIKVQVDSKAVKSAVYLISGKFNWTSIPKSYSLVSFVGNN